MQGTQCRKLHSVGNSGVNVICSTVRLIVGKVMLHDMQFIAYDV